MLNYRRTRNFAFLFALFLLAARHSDAQTFTSPESFGVYKSFPPINGTVVSQNSDAVTITIKRTGQSWNGSGWMTPSFSQASSLLATTMVGDRWSYGGKLPKEDGVYKITVLAHKGNSGHGIGIQIRVESGKNPPLTSLPAANATNKNLSLKSFVIPVFKPLIRIGLGHNAQNMVVADFNGDKKLDVAVDSDTNRISVLLGNGAGGFATIDDFATAARVSALATGDFNGDGKADIAATLSNMNSVAILLGNGKGELGTATQVPVGNDPLGLIAHDFNGDGHLDLAVANYGTNNKPDTVSILLGTGTGRFEATRNLIVEDGPNALATSDFNSDGKADLAVANFHSASISILLANETGFDAPRNIKVDNEPQCIATGDFNGDGKTDLATSNGHRWNDKQHSISILLGDGRGGFQATTRVVPGVQPQAIAAADFNGDGKTDLCIADSPLDHLVIFLGNGKGEFAPPINLQTGTNPRFLVVVDFNADSRLDIGAVTMNNISILLRESAPLASKTGQKSEALKQPLPDIESATQNESVTKNFGLFAATVGGMLLILGVFFANHLRLHNSN